MTWLMLLLHLATGIFSHCFPFHLVGILHILQKKLRTPQEKSIFINREKQLDLSTKLYIMFDPLFKTKNFVKEKQYTNATFKICIML